VVGDTLELTWNGQTSRYVKATPLGRLIPSSSEHR
jgi:hypothetical protein